jgi:hypothetical protein
MKTHWFLIALLSGVTSHACQGTTPQAALEEIATATNPEAIARHLPEPVQENIDILPKARKKLVMDKLLEIKESQLGGYTIRPAHGSDGWEIINNDGKLKGKAKLADAFISGVNALLPLEIDFGGGMQTFIVTMHLEDNEWRIDNFGPWEKSDLGLTGLLHQPTEMENNETAAQGTLRTLVLQLGQYARMDSRRGYPHDLASLTEPFKIGAFHVPALLDESFAADPVIKSGYQFSYLLTGVGDGTPNNPGTYEITATPVEFNKTGSKNYLRDMSGMHVTSENRPATEDDLGPDE